ncbi:DUF2497 domain-containing protein [Novosphingobium sp. 1949]|uniref:DUF2497 domain-containing protein n=1 Tax=Novosphingobium organovorum TaxID=2930092 RepID=A0ABT0BAZ1_9SPHN|nr:DUF2497 domain-containing protein [Novosphingobium organovorum]MCJ2182225.1 DUF2497 domain-containing protein [Novosphingobium organovorum]
MRQSGEPSVEEILQSIKKVIARDVQIQMPRHEGRNDSQSAPASRYEESVLELDEAEALGSEGSYGTAPEDEEPSLLQDASRKSMQDSLAALAMLSEPGSRPRIVRSGETSLEDLTRELLRPALAEWLDKNLPPMVERLVAAEIARIVGKQR